jgi:predicted DCC family thiol-disulfide oxidoreductase YuxK
MTKGHAAADATGGEHLILYDGVCGLCSRVIQFVAPRDRAGVFHYTPLQSPLGQSLLRRHGQDPTALDTFFIIVGHRSASPLLLSKARAALFIARTLRGPVRLAALLRVFPWRMLDWGYDRIARNRYRWFGRTDHCLLPAPEYRRRVLDS